MPEEIEQVALAEPKPFFTDEELYNLRAIKLNNGQDILACILATDPEHMIVKRPCQIFRVVQNDGNITIILAKWQPYSIGDNHIINRFSIVTYCKINDEMKEFYLQCVLKQLEDETTPKITFNPAWPDWMDQPIDKLRIN
jgi:hypothetical protein